MITVPTVLVLGAGSSTHAGYPLGRQLINQLASLRGSSQLDDLPEGWNRTAVENFLTRLSRSGHYSIDAFLESCPDQAPLGKYLIAQELKKYEDLNLLFPPHNSGWYQYLFNSLIAGDGSHDFTPNKLGIITFNYDRSLEAYLHEALQNRFQLDNGQAAQILATIPIVHVHGILGDYPATPYRTDRMKPELVQISRQIQIIHEIREASEGFCNSMFERAHGMLVSAERIYFLGFGFHADNVRRFKFFNPETVNGKTIRATAQGYTGLEFVRLKERLKEMGADDKALHEGTNCESFFSYQARFE